MRERKREAEEKEGEEEAAAAAKCFLKAIKVCTVQTAASQPAGRPAIKLPCPSMGTLGRESGTLRGTHNGTTEAEVASRMNLTICCR